MQPPCYPIAFPQLSARIDDGSALLTGAASFEAGFGLQHGVCRERLRAMLILDELDQAAAAGASCGVARAAFVAALPGEQRTFYASLRPRPSK